MIAVRASHESIPHTILLVQGAHHPASRCV